MSRGAIEQFLRRTELGAESRRRLRRRLGLLDPRQDGARDRLQRLTEADPMTLARIRRRIERPRESSSKRALLGAAVAVAAAAIALWWAGSGSDGPASLPIEHVSMALAGEGHVVGTREAPVLEWLSGRVDVSVTPHRGVDLTVRTPEAVVRVVGTVFAVERERRATRVSVSEGKVSVTCSGLPPVTIVAGGACTCLPAELSELLSRATELESAGAPAAERLQTIERALSLAEEGSLVRPELLARRISALADAGRREEALAEAEAYIASGAPSRRALVLSYAGLAAFEGDGCASRPALERAVAELPPGPEALLLASCLLHEDRARARALVDAAAPEVSGRWVEIAERLDGWLGAAR